MDHRRLVAPLGVRQRNVLRDQGGREADRGFEPAPDPDLSPEGITDEPRDRRAVPIEVAELDVEQQADQHHEQDADEDTRRDQDLAPHRPAPV